ncbi:MAG: hypothetical protein ACE368_03580 [Paracoccaceae bacterium]
MLLGLAAQTCGGDRSPGIAISIIGIVRIFWLRHRVRFNAEEMAFLNDALPHYPKTAARRLLDAGTWLDALDGVVLTEEGQPVSHLHYIASGSARVVAGGATVAEIARGMVGEMNVLDGVLLAASASLQARGFYSRGMRCAASAATMENSACFLSRA